MDGRCACTHPHPTPGSHSRSAKRNHAGAVRERSARAGARSEAASADAALHARRGWPVRPQSPPRACRSTSSQTPRLQPLGPPAGPQPRTPRAGGGLSLQPQTTACHTVSHTPAGLQLYPRAARRAGKLADMQGIGPGNAAAQHNCRSHSGAPAAAGRTAGAEHGGPSRTPPPLHPLQKQQHRGQRPRMNDSGVEQQVVGTRQRGLCPAVHMRQPPHASAPGAPVNRQLPLCQPTPHPAKRSQPAPPTRAPPPQTPSLFEMLHRLVRYTPLLPERCSLWVPARARPTPCNAATIVRETLTTGRAPIQQ
jgi:hypothetical protein